MSQEGGEPPGEEEDEWAAAGLQDLAEVSFDAEDFEDEDYVSDGSEDAGDGLERLGNMEFVTNDAPPLHSLSGKVLAHPRILAATDEGGPYYKQRAAAREDIRELMDAMAQKVIAGGHLFAYTAPEKHVEDRYLSNNLLRAERVNVSTPPDPRTYARDDGKDSEVPAGYVSSDDDDDAGFVDDAYVDQLLDFTRYVNRPRGPAPESHHPQFYQLNVVHYEVVNLSGVKWDARLADDYRDKSKQEMLRLNGESIGHVVQFDCILPYAALYKYKEHQRVATCIKCDDCMYGCAHHEKDVHAMPRSHHTPASYTAGLFLTDGYAVPGKGPVLNPVDETLIDNAPETVHENLEKFRAQQLPMDAEPSSFLGEAYCVQLDKWQSAAFAEHDVSRPLDVPIHNAMDGHRRHAHMRVVLTMAHLAALSMWGTATATRFEQPLPAPSFADCCLFQRVMKDMQRNGNLGVHYEQRATAINVDNYNAARELGCLYASRTFADGIFFEPRETSRVLSSFSSALVAADDRNCLAHFDVTSRFLVQSWYGDNRVAADKPEYVVMDPSLDYGHSVRFRQMLRDQVRYRGAEPYALQHLHEKVDEYGEDEVLEDNVRAAERSYADAASDMWQYPALFASLGSAFDLKQYRLNQARAKREESGLSSPNTPWYFSADETEINRVPQLDAHYPVFGRPEPQLHDRGVARWFNNTFLPQAIALVLHPSVLGLYDSHAVISRIQWMLFRLEEFERADATLQRAMFEGQLCFYGKRQLLQACALMPYLNSATYSRILNTLMEFHCPHWYSAQTFMHHDLGTPTPVRMDLDPRPLAVRTTPQVQCRALALAIVPVVNSYVASLISGRDDGKDTWVAYQLATAFQEYFPFTNKRSHVWRANRDYLMLLTAIHRGEDFQFDEIYVDPDDPDRQDDASNLEHLKELEDRRIARLGTAQQLYTDWVRRFMATCAMPFCLYHTIQRRIMQTMTRHRMALYEAWKSNTMLLDLAISRAHNEAPAEQSFTSIYMPKSTSSAYYSYETLVYQWMLMPAIARSCWVSPFFATYLIDGLFSHLYDMDWEAEDMGKFATIDGQLDTNRLLQQNPLEDEVGMTMLAMAYSRSNQCNIPWVGRLVFGVLGCIAMMLERCPPDLKPGTEETKAFLQQREDKECRELYRFIIKNRTSIVSRYKMILKNIKWSCGEAMHERMQRCYDAMKGDSQTKYCWNPRDIMNSDEIEWSGSHSWLVVAASTYHTYIRSIKKATRTRIAVRHHIVEDERAALKMLSERHASRSALANAAFATHHMHMQFHKYEMECDVLAESRMDDTQHEADPMIVGIMRALHVAERGWYNLFVQVPVDESLAFSPLLPTEV